MSLYNRAVKAMTYLAKTDEATAKAKARMKGLEDQKKTILAIEALKQEGLSAAAALKAAEASHAYQDHLKQYEEAVFDYEILHNKRNTEQMAFEMWRSCNANQRQGGQIGDHQ